VPRRFESPEPTRNKAAQERAAAAYRHVLALHKRHVKLLGDYEDVLNDHGGARERERCRRLEAKVLKAGGGGPERSGRDVGRSGADCPAGRDSYAG
jgi:hypothetical protein